MIDEGPVGTTQLVVEADAGRQAEKALQDAFGKAGQGTGPVLLQGENVFAGPEDGLDALADGSQVRTRSGLGFWKPTGTRTIDRTQELPVRADAHGRVRHGQSDRLSVCHTW